MAGGHDPGVRPRTGRGPIGQPLHPPRGPVLLPRRAGGHPAPRLGRTDQSTTIHRGITNMEYATYGEFHDRAGATAAAVNAVRGPIGEPFYVDDIAIAAPTGPRADAGLVFIGPDDGGSGMIV